MNNLSFIGMKNNSGIIHLPSGWDFSVCIGNLPYSTFLAPVR